MKTVLFVRLPYAALQTQVHILDLSAFTLLCGIFLKKKNNIHCLGTTEMFMFQKIIIG